MKPDLSQSGVMVFDLDGTLVDSVGDIAFAANCVLERHRAEPLDLLDVAPLIGLPAAALFAHVDGGPVEAFVREFRAVLAKEAGTRARVYPGVVPLLAQLCESNWIASVATNKPTFLAQIVLDRMGLSPFLVDVVGADGLRPKPAPDVVLRCLEGRDRAARWMVGDTTMDIHAGFAAGATTVAIASGSHTAEELRTATPTALYSSFQEFAQALGVVADE